MLNAPPIPGSDYKAIAFDKRLAHGAFRLWHVLRDYAGQKKSCWPGQRRLCRDLGSNFETVAGWRDQLIRNGWLRIRSGKGGRHVYSIGNFSIMDALEESGSATESGSAPHPKAVAHAATESGSETNGIKLTPRTKGNAAPRSGSETWKLLRDEESLTKRIKTEAESCKPDRDLIEALKIERRKVRDEMKGPERAGKI